MSPAAFFEPNDLADDAKPAPRSCSLRSTQLTTSSASSYAFEPACFGEWVYWQRDSANQPECWTKVFAIVDKDDASVCLYECEDMSTRTLVCRRSMHSVTVAGSRRRLKLVDVHGAVIMRLWLLNHANHELWKTCLESAVQVAALNTPMPATPDQNDTIIMSGMSLLSLRRHRETRTPRVSKRSIVRAVCRDAFSQLRGKLHGRTER